MAGLLRLIVVVLDLINCVLRFRSIWEVCELIIVTSTFNSRNLSRCAYDGLNLNLWVLFSVCNFAVADLLLWKNKTGAVILLVSSTGFWFLFERAGYNLLSFVSNVLLLLVAILFLWAKSATVLNR